MTELNSNASIVPVSAVPKEPIKVGDGITTFYDANNKLGNSGDDVVTDVVLAAQKADIDKLQEKETGMLGGDPDRKPQRDMAYATSYGHYIDNMGLLTIRVRHIVDPLEKIAFIKRNGYMPNKIPIHPPNPDISIKNKKNEAGTITVQVKSPGNKKAFAVEWEYSYDGGLTWIRVYATGVCKRDIVNLKSAGVVCVRARIIIGNDAPGNWMISGTITIAYFQPLVDPE